MPKKCDHCGFFHSENGMTVCPDCGQELKFTMFVPPGCETEENREPQGAHEAAACELLELPWGVRLTQIGAGIGLFDIISYEVKHLFFGICLISGDNFHADKLQKMAIVYLMMTLAFYVLGALAGGAIAGARSVNWVPQGIGVGIGVLILLLILYFLFGPVKGIGLMGFAVLLSITTAMSVLGAFIGHKLVRPSRYVIS
jgi:hypothetical protein